MSPHVHILDNSYPIPQLGRTRRIWVYLPADYHTSPLRYPVLYMQDGQNLFDADTAAYGEWGVDEQLDHLIDAGNPGIIVVGIDHGGNKRVNEYNPMDSHTYGKGEGRQYAAFLAETLKPFIDDHFRTISTPGQTGIAGSSMGGLISFYTWLSYPDVFGGAGIFSPSFWICPQLKKAIHRDLPQKNNKLYLVAGDQESDRMIPDMRDIHQLLLGEGMPPGHMLMKILKGGKHSEAYWKQEFPMMYLWLFSGSGPGNP